MRVPTLLALFSLLFFACQQMNTESDVPKIGEWQTIFNGKDLSGWKTMGQVETKIENEELRIHATAPNNNAWVYSEKEYENFKLECEFLMPDTLANSGVLIRFDRTKVTPPNSTAFEANIDWHKNIQTPMGTLEFASRANLIEDPKPNEWQKMEIEANGDHIIVKINGQKMSETHNRRAPKGHVAFQVPIYEGDDISFRNIRLMEMEATSELPMALQEEYRNSLVAFKPMFIDKKFEGWQTIGPGTFTWEGNVLHGYSGETPSFLVTDKTYKNFHMKFNFKIIKDDNSGIFIRKHPDSTNVSLQDAIECNIYDHNGLAHPYSTGSIVTHARAWGDMISYTGWNEMEIFAKEDHILLFINGKKSAEAHVPSQYNKAGNICLQAGTKVFLDDSPSDIYFRNLLIREFD